MSGIGLMTRLSLEILVATSKTGRLVGRATSDTASANAPANAPANASVKLSKTQIAIVKAIINNNHVTYNDLKTILGVDRSTITRNIAVLKEKGVIRRVGLVKEVLRIQNTG